MVGRVLGQLWHPLALSPLLPIFARDLLTSHQNLSGGRPSRYLRQDIRHFQYSQKDQIRAESERERISFTITEEKREEERMMSLMWFPADGSAETEDLI